MVIEKRWAASCFFSFSPKSPFLLDLSQSCAGNVWYILWCHNKWILQRHGVNDNANSCNSPISVAGEEIPDLYAVKVGLPHSHPTPQLSNWYLEETRLNTEDDENHFPLFRKPGIAQMNWKVAGANRRRPCNGRGEQHTDACKWSGVSSCLSWQQIQK